MSTHHNFSDEIRELAAAISKVCAGQDIITVNGALVWVLSEVIAQGSGGDEVRAFDVADECGAMLADMLEVDCREVRFLVADPATMAVN